MIHNFKFKIILLSTSRIQFLFNKYNKLYSYIKNNLKMFSPENLTKHRLGSAKADDQETTPAPQVNFEERLKKIIEMMESKYTYDLTDRHVDTIQKLMDEMNTKEYAFYYKDLQTLSTLISTVFQRITSGKHDLIPQLISLVKICNRPFLKEKTSDELNHVPKTVFLLNSICEILQYDNSQNEQLFILFLECMRFLNDFAAYGLDEYKNQEADYHMKKLYGNAFSLLSTLQTEGTRNLRQVSQSNVLLSLVYVITNNVYNEDSTILVINTMLNCALFKNNAEKLAGLGVLKDLVQIIANTIDFRSLLVRVCIEAIWNILENGGRRACRMMAFEEIVNSLFHTFNTVIKNCFRLEDRNIRNDICILINYVVSSPESHVYFIYKDDENAAGDYMTQSTSSNQVQNGENYTQTKGSTVGRMTRTELSRDPKDLDKRSFLEKLLYYATFDETTINREREIEKEFKEKSDQALLTASGLNGNNNSQIMNGNNTLYGATGSSMKKNRTSFIDPHEFFLTTSPEDIEFKKIIWTSILYIIKDNHSKEEVVHVLKQYSFLHCLLLYLEPEAMKYTCISRWQQPQLKDLQILCLSILLNIIPLYQQ
jgi:hypothetical protein